MRRSARRSVSSWARLLDRENLIKTAKTVGAFTVVVPISMYLGHLEGKFLYKWFTGRDWDEDHRMRRIKGAHMQELERKYYAELQQGEN